VCGTFYRNIVVVFKVKKKSSFVFLQGLFLNKFRPSFTKERALHMR